MARGSLAPIIMMQILDHARSQRMVEGQHLPAQALADAFRVSRAPVVGALKLLADRGLVRSEANRGFFLATDAADLPDTEAAAAKLPDSDTEDAAYFRIAEDRAAGKLPDRVSVNEMMRLYGLSRGRIMTILYQIAEEGWIDRLPGNGWQFRETLTSSKAYSDAYAFRAAIEKEALLQPGFRPDPEAFARARQQQMAMLDDGFRQGRAKIFAGNVDFHEMLMACANNDFFLDAVRRVNRLRRLIEYRITTDRSRLPQQSREHLQILDMIEAGDMVEAADFLFQHVSNVARLKVSKLD